MGRDEGLEVNQRAGPGQHVQTLVIIGGRLAVHPSFACTCRVCNCCLVSGLRAFASG